MTIKYFEITINALDEVVDNPLGLNLDTMLIIGVSALVIAFLIYLVTSFIVEEHKNHKWRSSMVDKTASARIYCFDQYKDEVIYFNLSSLSKVRKTTFDQFYASLPSYEAPKVRDWIDSHEEGKEETPYFLPTEIIVHGEKRILKSFLRVTKIDKTTNKIHAESHIIQYDTPKSIIEKNFSSIDELALALEKNGYETGMTYCFSLFPKKEGSHPENDQLACDRFIKEIINNASGNQLVLKASKTEVIIANFDQREPSQAMAYALQVNYNAAKEANAKKRGIPLYEVRAGVVANKDLGGSADLIVTEVRKAAENAAISKTSVFFYNRDSSTLSAAEESSFKTEVERIVTNKRLVSSYRPVVKSSDGSIVGYMSKITPINTTFGKIEELQNYALRANDSSTLFNEMARLTISKFKRESKEISKKQLWLFYPMRTLENNLALSFFHIAETSKKYKIIFLYSDKDIAGFCSHNGVDEFLEFVDKINSLKILFGMQFSSKTTNVDKRIMSKAAAFVVNFGASSDVVIDTKARSELYALTSKLLTYQKPIIAGNLPSWNAIELVVGSGIEYVSSDPLSPYDTMFKPLSEKKVARITSIKKN